MKLVVCVIIDKEVDSLLLVEQTLGRGYWFPFDEIKPGETRALAAKRITSKVSFFFIRLIILQIFFDLDLSL